MRLLVSYRPLAHAGFSHSHFLAACNRRRELHTSAGLRRVRHRCVCKAIDVRAAPLRKATTLSTREHKKPRASSDRCAARRRRTKMADDPPEPPIRRKRTRGAHQPPRSRPSPRPKWPVEGSGATRKLTKRRTTSSTKRPNRPRNPRRRSPPRRSPPRKNEERGAYYLCLVQRRKQ